MSLQYSNTTTKNGVVQVAERRIYGSSNAQISGSTAKLQDFTAEVNLAIDEILGFLFPIDGTWQLDDSNHSSYPILTTNLVSGQRDYSFTEDSLGNVILDFYKVLVADSSGNFTELSPVDQQTKASNNSDTLQFYSGTTVSGVPTEYDKTANGIFLNPVPNYNYSGGLKVFINREASYFDYSDTTKVLGFAHLFHEYLALKPAYNFARDNNIVTAERLKRDVLEMRQAIINYYGKRQKDVRGRLRPNIENTK